MSLLNQIRFSWWWKLSAVSLSTAFICAALWAGSRKEAAQLEAAIRTMIRQHGLEEVRHDGDGSSLARFLMPPMRSTYEGKPVSAADREKIAAQIESVSPSSELKRISEYHPDASCIPVRFPGMETLEWRLPEGGTITRFHLMVRADTDSEGVVYPTELQIHRPWPPRWKRRLAKPIGLRY